MVKIETTDGHTERTLKLEGSLIGLWVDELRRSCDMARLEGRRVTLDLTDVGFVDWAGLELLRTLEEAGVSFANASRFVVEQLKAAAR